MRRIEDRWFQLRDALLSDRRFQRWAAAFPLTRLVARRRALQAFDLCAGFVYSQILHACVRLGVLERLKEGPCTVDALASQIGLSCDSTKRLLRAAQAIGLVAQRRPQGTAERFGLGAAGAAFLANPGALRMIEHHELFYRDLADPVTLLRNPDIPTELSRYWAYATADKPADLKAGDVDGYTALMAASQTLVCEEILDAYDFSRHRCLLDVGGGNGTFLAAVGARVSKLELILFDLPAVAAHARERFDTLGMSGRAKAIGGDFRQDPLPLGADVISFVRVLHDHDDATVDLLLRKANAALAPGGVVVVAEPMSDTPGAARVADAYFGFYLAAMKSGRPRSPEQLSVMLRRNGFCDVRKIPTHMPMQTSVLSARI
jgi:demethylspheroidene O-methyltransferase